MSVRQRCSNPRGLRRSQQEASGLSALLHEGPALRHKCCRAPNRLAGIFDGRVSALISLGGRGARNGPDAGLGHYGRGDVAAVARVLVSMLTISRRAIAAGMTAL